MMTHRDEIISCRKCYLLRLAAVVIWTVGLFAISLMPNGTVQGFSHMDKLLHLMAYALTAWLACRAFLVHSMTMVKTVILSLFYAIIVGALLEYLQGALTTTRASELADVFANIAGAILGSAIFCLQQKINCRHHDIETG